MLPEKSLEKFLTAPEDIFFFRQNYSAQTAIKFFFDFFQEFPADPWVE